MGYDADLEVLELEFQSGRVYQYEDVPESVHADLIDASSLGSHFNANIRGAFFYRLVS